MKKFTFLLTVLVLIAEISNADSRIYGVWENAEQKLRLDILDGFKAGQGPILQIKDDGSVEAGSWEEKSGEIKVKLGYSSYTLGLDGDSKIFLNPSYGDGISFLKTKPKDSSQSVTLKDNEAAFLDKLIANEWVTSEDGAIARFQSDDDLQLVLIRSQKEQVWMEYKGPTDAFASFESLISELHQQIESNNQVI